MRVLHVSKSENLGGAARAANRLHHCLLEDLDSAMLVGSKQTDDPNVIKHGGRIEDLKYQLKASSAQRLLKLVVKQPGLQSLSCYPSSVLHAINQDTADIIHLHWIQGEFLSVCDVSKIRKPVVWSLHDMWPLGGTAHYFQGVEEGIETTEDKEPFFSKLRLSRKIKLWKNTNITFLANSSWMYEQAVNSPVTRSHNVRLLHNPLDTEVWKPVNKTVAREVLSIKNDKRVILFGAIGGTSDPRKGFSELSKALSQLSISGDLDNTMLLVFGAQALDFSATIKCEVKCLGHIHDDIAMSLIYSAADVMLVPSLQEAFGQTASEANACGTPVVCFNVGGLRDTVVHEKSGYLADRRKVHDLARGIKFVLDHPNPESLGEYARVDIVRKYSHQSILGKYKELYQNVLNGK
jgi:glycosyltransferase involved in cell wall biosynthesis